MHLETETQAAGTMSQILVQTVCVHIWGIQDNIQLGESFLHKRAGYDILWTGSPPAIKRGIMRTSEHCSHSHSATLHCQLACMFP